MAAAFLVAVLPLVGGLLSILVAVFVTLRKGAFEGTLVLCAAMAPLVFGYIQSSSADEGQLVILIITGFIFATNIWTWVLALVLRRSGNWSLVTSVAAVMGMLIVAGVHLVFPDVAGWWEREITAYFTKTSSILSMLAPGNPELIPADVQATLIGRARRYGAGFVVSSVMINAILQLMVARWWQAAIFNPGGLRKELYRIRLSYVLTAVFMIIFAAGFTGSAVCLDLLPVLFMAYCLAGLSLLHVLFNKIKTGTFWLICIYAGVCLWVPYGVVIVAIAALFDSLFNFRKRLMKLG